MNALVITFENFENGNYSETNKEDNTDQKRMHHDICRSMVTMKTYRMRARARAKARARARALVRRNMVDEDRRSRSP